MKNLMKMARTAATDMAAQPLPARCAPEGARVPARRGGFLAVGALAIALLAGAMITRAVVAGDVAPTAPSGSGAGGDSVGSLPLNAGSPGTGSSAAGASAYAGHVMPDGPSRPVLALVGTQAELDALLFDAFGTGTIEYVPLANGLVRMEFHGRMTVELHRAALASSLVSVQIVVGSSFHGGKAKLLIDHVFKARQTLVSGSQEVRLQQLVQAGIVDQGLLWHAKSLAGVHAILDFNDHGNLIRIQQRD